MKQEQWMLNRLKRVEAQAQYIERRISRRSPIYWYQFGLALMWIIIAFLVITFGVLLYQGPPENTFGAGIGTTVAAVICIAIGAYVTSESI